MGKHPDLLRVPRIGRVDPDHVRAAVPGKPPGQEREYCNSIISVRSVPVVKGQWTKVEKTGVVTFYEHIVTLDILMGVRHSGSDPPVVNFDDFSLTPVSGDGGY